MQCCCYFCCRRRRCFCCGRCRRRRRCHCRRRLRLRRLLRRRDGVGSRRMAATAAVAVDNTDQQRPSQSSLSLSTNQPQRPWNRISVRSSRLLDCYSRQTSSPYSCPRPGAASADTALASNPLGPSVCATTMVLYYVVVMMPHRRDNRDKVILTLFDDIMVKRYQACRDMSSKRVWKIHHVSTYLYPYAMAQPGEGFKGLGVVTPPKCF